MAGIRSGTVVAGLTAAAVAAIAVLAVQASGSVRTEPAKAPPVPSASASPSGSPTVPRVPALPENSGSGKRAVLSLSAKRVWLAEGSDTVLRTYPVAPGSVTPAAGDYTVTSRTGRTTGGDGVPIEHVVRFASVGGVGIGFSSALDDSMPSADPAEKTGGIREKREDGDALWEFAVIGTRITVVP